MTRRGKYGTWVGDGPSRRLESPTRAFAEVREEARKQPDLDEMDRLHATRTDRDADPDERVTVPRWVAIAGWATAATGVGAAVVQAVT